MNQIEKDQYPVLNIMVEIYKNYSSDAKSYQWCKFDYYYNLFKNQAFVLSQLWKIFISHKDLKSIYQKEVDFLSRDKNYPTPELNAKFIKIYSEMNMDNIIINFNSNGLYNVDDKNNSYLRDNFNVSNILNRFLNEEDDPSLDEIVHTMFFDIYKKFKNTIELDESNIDYYKKLIRLFKMYNYICFLHCSLSNNFSKAIMYTLIGLTDRESIFDSPKDHDSELIFDGIKTCVQEFMDLFFKVVPENDLGLIN